jgi:hypothetical protein
VGEAERRESHARTSSTGEAHQQAANVHSRPVHQGECACTVGSRSLVASSLRPVVLPLASHCCCCRMNSANGCRRTATASSRGAPHSLSNLRGVLHGVAASTLTALAKVSHQDAHLCLAVSGRRPTDNRHDAAPLLLPRPAHRDATSCLVLSACSASFDPSFQLGRSFIRRSSLRDQLCE